MNGGPPKPGWVNDFPTDRVQIDSGRRNPLFYVGEAISFQLSPRIEIPPNWRRIDLRSATIGAKL